MSQRELKFIIPQGSTRASTFLLESICGDDKEYKSNIINSLYFDSGDWVFAMEKASSDFLKSKVRLRWYQDDLSRESSTACFLEIKHKVGSTRNKKRVEMPYSLDEVLSILKKEPYPDFMRRHIAKESFELSCVDLEPKFILSYSRRRFYEHFSKSRVALDNNITAKKFSTGAGFVQDFIKLPDSIVEIKGDSMVMPEALRTLSIYGAKKIAFSKYYECFSKLTGYEQ